MLPHHHSAQLDDPPLPHEPPIPSKRTMTTTTMTTRIGGPTTGPGPCTMVGNHRHPCQHRVAITTTTTMTATFLPIFPTSLELVNTLRCHPNPNDATIIMTTIIIMTTTTITLTTTMTTIIITTPRRACVPPYWRRCKRDTGEPTASAWLANTPTLFYPNGCKPP